MKRLMKTRWHWGAGLIFGILLIGASMVHAQSSPNYRIKVDVISGGGGGGTSTNYGLQGVIGQPSPIGVSSSTSYWDDGGYLYAWLGSLGSSARCDFNGDGKTDILWRYSMTGDNAVWLMDGTTVSSVVHLDPVSDTAWEIVGPK